MPRKSSAAVAFSTISPGARLHPPEDLAGPERKLFVDLVVACRPDHFQNSDAVILAAYCRAIVLEKTASAGLVADGVIGDSTWHKMPADPDTPILRRGTSGRAVSGLQKGLLKLGPGTPTDPGQADGIFGPRTEAAVKAYQLEHSLPGDGVVGPRTWWVPAGAAGATLASLAELTTV